MKTKKIVGLKAFGELLKRLVPVPKREVGELRKAEKAQAAKASRKKKP